MEIAKAQTTGEDFLKKDANEYPKMSFEKAAARPAIVREKNFCQARKVS